MKKIILLLFMMLYFFKPIIPLASYVIQYDYIVNELCVNRDDRSKGCNGKCHLMKEVGKMSDKESKDYKFPVFETVQFIEPIVSIEFPHVTTASHTSVPDMYSNLYVSTSLGNTSPPPLV
nr:hypothetical protein [uncultured Flavobacterium sp.]